MGWCLTDLLTKSNEIPVNPIQLEWDDDLHDGDDNNMPSKGRYSIVAYISSLSGPQLRDESKIFRVKQQARQYAASLMDNPNTYKSKSDPGWKVIDMETILD